MSYIKDFMYRIIKIVQKTKRVIVNFNFNCPVKIYAVSFKNLNKYPEFVSI